MPSNCVIQPSKERLLYIKIHKLVICYATPLFESLPEIAMSYCVDCLWNRKISLLGLRCYLSRRPDRHLETSQAGRENLSEQWHEHRHNWWDVTSDNIKLPGIYHKSFIDAVFLSLASFLCYNSVIPLSYLSPCLPPQPITFGYLARSLFCCYGSIF